MCSSDLDEYDKLIQLCDSLAGPDGVLDIEERMGDAKKRYDFYYSAVPFLGINSLD